MLKFAPTAFLLMAIFGCSGTAPEERGQATVQRRDNKMNAMMVIAPYRYEGTWVFDDRASGSNANRLLPGFRR